MSDWTLSLLVLLGSWLFSFFMSGMEAGLLAVSRVRIRHWARAGKPRARLLLDFLEKPEDFLWTILVGNTLATVTFVSLVVWGVLVTFPDQGWTGLGVFLAATFLYYSWGDLLPKMIFRTYPNRLTLALVRPFQWVHTLLRPSVWVVSRLANRVLRWGGAQDKAGRLLGNRDELRLIIQESEQVLTSEERRMINRVLDLPGVRVGQLLTPMDRVVAVEVETPMAEVLRLCREKSLTRLLVWRGAGPDRRVAGVVSMSRLLYEGEVDGARRAGEFLQPAVYLSEELSLEQALRRMQRSGQRLAVVLGRGRRELGVVSLQDFLRFIFGEVTL
jgi:CBS domain containing-hemolysin-like protein